MFSLAPFAKFGVLQQAIHFAMLDAVYRLRSSFTWNFYKRTASFTCPLKICRKTGYAYFVYFVRITGNTQMRKGYTKCLDVLCFTLGEPLETVTFLGPEMERKKRTGKVEADRHIGISPPMYHSSYTVAQLSYTI